MADEKFWIGWACENNNVGNDYFFLEKKLESYILVAAIPVKVCDRVISNEV